ncbi:MAG TPA: hypothetical protein VFV67_01795 [Actinophytocola sp.]|uniref:hypothetical protein n=1 Tax=Actinophytocola sp. TaxID=1872138 RepID=UPI002DBA1A65|nr:hypothetical protein [Actinophytocola sp.]HEU5469357.1 hypothetical protein [Actinophytocola sp.]
MNGPCTAEHCGTDPVDAVVERVMTGSGVGAALGLVCAVGGCRGALLTALAARHLLPPGVVTASVIGRGEVKHRQLMAIVRHVPGVSHVSVRGLGGEPVHPWVAGQVELAGVGLTVAGTAREAAFGANLVVVTGFDQAEVWPAHLANGAVLVNATGREPDRVMLAMVGRIFVDDAVLLDRAELPWGSRVEGDLRQVLTGEHPGRTGPDEVLLVELLNNRPMRNREFSCRFNQRSSSSL